MLKNFTEILKFKELVSFARVETTDHRLTDPPITYYLPTDQISSTYVKIEDQVLYRFLPFFALFNS